MKKEITLTMEELKKYDLVQKAIEGSVITEDLAMLLGLSERQCYRLKSAVKEKGIKGVIHGNRGRSGKEVAAELKARIASLAKGEYKGFNDHHLTEKLEEEKGIRLSRETVRQILRAAGIEAVRKRRRSKHRCRRERMPQEGMMLQVDASHHDWLEGRGPKFVLVGAIDDATNKIHARFEPAETSEGYMRLFMDIFIQNGLPHSIYADRHSIFQVVRENPTVAEQLRGVADKTQVGRALEELGVTLIAALSPQAKGRIERAWGTFQDRLVSELRLARAATMAEAGKVLERYLEKHNRSFIVTPTESQKAWRDFDLDLHRYLSVQYVRVVANDNTISLDGIKIQIPSTKTRYSFAKAKVEVHLLLDGRVRVYYKDELLLEMQGFERKEKTKKQNKIEAYLSEKILAIA